MRRKGFIQMEEGLRTDSQISRRIVTSFLHFLSSVEPAPGVDVEGLEVARECLAEVFGVRVDDYPSRSGSQPDSLVELFQSINVCGPLPRRNETSVNVLPKTSTCQGGVQSGKLNPADSSKDELFGHFFAALDKANFFSCTPDKNEGAQQLDKVTRLFHNALAEMGSSGCQDYSTKNLAETLKTQGNKALQAKLYIDAIEFYSTAIALNEDNAVYYCNRAAAYTHIGQFSIAINDCLKALEIDPNYWKAYSRLGNAYYGMARFADAIEKGYKKALLLDPNNESIKENIQAAEIKLKEELHCRENNQWNAGTHHDHDAFPGQSTSRTGSGAAPPSFTSFPFDPSTFPVNFTNVFMNMAPNPSSHGEHAQSAPERDGNHPGFDGPRIRIDDNVSLSMGGSMPEEISGALRNVIQMFAGSASHGSSETTSEGTAPR